MSDVPMATVLIPARNEEADIEGCLRAVLAQDHPHDRMEIVLVDGGSTDGTADIASALLSVGGVDWKIIDNPTGTTPSNLNAGLRVAAGDVLCRVDARSIVPPEYVRLCAEVLTGRPEVAVTGGAQVAVPPDSSVRGVGIARALNNRYAMGRSKYRSGAPSGPTDTVYLGAFRTAELRAAGGWDEAMLTNQDFELNRRLGRAGVVWFDGRLLVQYLPREHLHSVARQYHRFGRWKVRYWRHTGEGPQRRQWVAIALPPLALCAAVVPALIGRRQLRATGATAAAGVAALVVIEHLGCVGPEGGPKARASASLTMVLVALGWFSGVAIEAIEDAARAALRRLRADGRS